MSFKSVVFTLWQTGPMARGRNLKLNLHLAHGMDCLPLSETLWLQTSLADKYAKKGARKEIKVLLVRVSKAEVKNHTKQSRRNCDRS